MGKAISERHEIVVETDESIVVLTADSRDGRLVIQQRKKRGSAAGREVCSLSLANPAELKDFFDGLRRLLASTGLAPAVSAPTDGAARPRPAAGRSAVLPPRGAATPEQGEDRDEIVARARGRNPKAFEPWTPAEEKDVRRRFQAGERIEDIARAHNRSPKAIQMRLERLGLTPRS
jgi:hypothetical protein